MKYKLFKITACSILLGVILILCPQPGGAAYDGHNIRKDSFAVLELRSGGELEGVLVSGDSGQVTIDIGSGTMSVNSGDIVSVDYPERSPKKAGGTRNISEKDAGEKREEELERIRQRNFGYLKAREISLEKERAKSYVPYSGTNDRIIVEAVINDRIKVVLLVDTGAPTVYITPEMAKKVVSRKVLEDPARQSDVKWVGGKATKVTSFFLDSLKVGSARVKNVRAVAGDMPFEVTPKVDGLLGMSFLNNFKFRIDTENNRLKLEKKGGTEADER